MLPIRLSLLLTPISFAFSLCFLPLQHASPSGVTGELPMVVLTVKLVHVAEQAISLSIRYCMEMTLNLGSIFNYKLVLAPPGV